MEAFWKQGLPTLSTLETFRYNKEYKLILRGKVVLAEHSLPPLSILEIFRYNKEYELILERRDKKCRWHFLDAASGFHVVNVLVTPLFEGC